MAKEQRYMSELLDELGNVVDFERWPCKRASTVIKKVYELYTYPIYRKDLKKGTLGVVIYPTKPNGERCGINVARIPTAELYDNKSRPHAGT